MFSFESVKNPLSPTSRLVRTSVIKETKGRELAKPCYRAQHPRIVPAWTGCKHPNTKCCLIFSGFLPYIKPLLEIQDGILAPKRLYLDLWRLRHCPSCASHQIALQGSLDTCRAFLEHPRVLELFQSSISGIECCGCQSVGRNMRGEYAL